MCTAAIVAGCSRPNDSSASRSARRSTARPVYGSPRELGPHADNEHGIDERVSLPSMLRTAQAIAVFIADGCRLGGGRARHEARHADSVG